MKYLSLFVLICTVLVVQAFAAGTQESAAADDITKSYVLSGFTSLELDGSFRYLVRQGKTWSVSARGSQSALGILKLRVSGNTLLVSQDPFWFYKPAMQLQVEIIMPELQDFSADGAVTGTILMDSRTVPVMNIALDGAARLDANLICQTLQLSLDGAAVCSGRMVLRDGQLSMDGMAKLEARLESPSMKIDLDGASLLTLDGQCEWIDIRAHGASVAQLQKFELREAKISLDGAARAQLLVRERLDAQVNGASVLEYGGSPVAITKKQAGAGVIQARKP